MSLFLIAFNIVPHKTHSHCVFLQSVGADASSLELIEILATDKKNFSLLVIGTYRQDEVSKTHPLSVRLKEIRQSDVYVRHLSIGELPLGVVNTFVSDTINMPEAEVEPLSALVHAKTKGNGMFHLHSVYGSKLLLRTC